MNEKKLAEQLALGSTDALGRIIETYTGYVRTVAFNFSRDMLTNEDIEEITAEVFYKLWKARKNINAELGLRSYLSAAARNTVKNRFKQNPPPSEDISELQIPSDLLVEDTAELNEMLSCLYSGLRKLSADDQEIFYRFYFNGEKASQIAEEKNTSKAAVDTRLHRIRNKLKDYLNERGYDHV